MELEFLHALNDLCSVDVLVIPLDAIACGHAVAVVHAADELLVWALVELSIQNTCLSSVVKKFIVAHPQCHVPGFVVCPTVVGCVFDLCLVGCGHE